MQCVTNVQGREALREDDSIRTNSAYGTSNKQGPDNLYGITRWRAVLTLVRHARRRWLRNELLSQGSNAFSAALIAFILLLLVGTEVLRWEWALAIPLAAAGFGIFLARRRTPRLYEVAQVVDRRLSLADTLSTALFFHQNETSSQSSIEIRQYQFERAERLAESVDVRQAIPYTMPRAAYLMVALLLVASSLFALRYGISHSLDLKPPLARMLQDQFGWKPKTVAAKDKRTKTPPPPEAQQDDSGAAADSQDEQGSQEPDAQNNESQAGGDQQADKNDGNPKGDDSKQAEKGDKKGGDEGADAQAEEKSDSSTDPSDSPQQGNGGKQDQAQSGSQQDSNSGENSSLLSKVKDAVQNLLSKVKPQQGNQGSQQQAGADQGQKQQGQGKQNGGKQQQSAKNGQQSGEQQQGDAQDGQAGDESKQSQDQQGKGAGKSDTHQASKQPGSGIGSQDGDKSIKQAEQLAAMGKISEILGKRSANISGESTVEVQSTSQTLRTQYVQRGVQHTQGGAEISRDEIPVALQPFVEQYFEQMRKQVPAAAATVKKQ